MPEWKVENLRVTGFMPSADAEDLAELWAAVVGAPPDRIEQNLKNGTSRLEGPFEEAQLILAREPSRMDWLWVVTLDPTIPFQEYPAIGSTKAVFKTFSLLAETWLKRGPDLTRLALGGVFVLPVSNREEGYRALSGFLPQLNIDPVGSSDLSYQINRPRTSKVIESLRVNRLSKWSVGLKQSISVGLVLSPDSAAHAVGGPTGPGLSACRLEFDINSDAARKEPFAADELVPLLGEFVAMAQELATRGDLP